MVVPVLWLFALINLGIGLACLVDPVGLLEPVGVGVLGPSGIVELRAMYGGMLVGLAGFLCWCALDAQRARVGLSCAVATVGGLGVARLASWVMLAPEGWLFPALCAFEIGGAAAGVWVLRQPSESTTSMAQ